MTTDENSGKRPGWDLPPVYVPIKRQKYLGEIAPMTRYFLDAVILPVRRDGYRGPPSVEEVAQANANAHAWGQHWFDLAQVKRWRDVHGEVSPSAAAALRDVGVTPEQALERPWYGKRNPARRTLLQRVETSEITAEQALDELRSLDPE